jgi:hypothetical protein
MSPLTPSAKSANATKKRPLLPRCYKGTLSERRRKLFAPFTP